jgi:glycosyltransferase involved in cell wall biosynthesis
MPPPTSAAPLVTVFMPVHNRAHLLGRAIESILAQSFRELEMLIIDDGSTDGSVAAVRRYSDPRIRLLENGQNLGIARTRQRGLDEARGAYLAVLDSDDQAAPRRLERQVAFLDSNPSVATLGGWARALDTQGRVHGSIKPLPLASAELKARLLFRTCHHHSSVMGRVSVLREFGYDPRFDVSSDYDLFARIAQHHELANIPRVLLHRGLHAGRVTTARSAEVKRMNMIVAARQLEALGLPSDEPTVARHVGIARLKKEGTSPDEAWLAETARWFDRLIDANERARIYEPSALKGVLAQLWAVACIHARERIGITAVRALFDSPLCASLPISAARNLAAALGRDPTRS